jgi:hypothetical protein
VPLPVNQLWHRHLAAAGSAAKTAGNSEKQRAASLLFWPPKRRQPKISAANEISLAVNLPLEQLKQRRKAERRGRLLT